jgi:hypothetical protein
MARELIRLNSGDLADSLRHAGILAASISSNAHEVTAKISIIDRSIVFFLCYNMNIVKASYRISEAELASVLIPYTIKRVPGIY